MAATGSTLVHGSPLPAPMSQHPRLAELVTHLTECPAPLAVAAVNAATGAPAPAVADLDHHARLAIVAEAMLAVRRRIDLRDGK